MSSLINLDVYNLYYISLPNDPDGTYQLGSICHVRSDSYRNSLPDFVKFEIFMIGSLSAFVFEAGPIVYM